MVESLPQEVLDNVLRDRAGLDEALADRDWEIGSLTGRLEAAERALAEAQQLAAEREAQLLEIAGSATWRLRGRLLGVPGFRSVARALARRAAPAATGPPGRDGTPEP
jgi:hypothetical protein